MTKPAPLLALSDAQRFLRTGATKFSFYPVNDFRDLKTTMHATLQGSEVRPPAQP